MRSFAFLTALLILPTAIADPISRYYVTGFGSESPGNRARYSHSFFRFEEVRGDGTRNVVDINWIPQDRYMRGRQDLGMPLLGRKPGQNPDIGATIQRAQQADRDIYQHGPFEIRKELFDLAEIQAGKLNRGELKYLGLSALLKRPDAPQCIYAADLLGTAKPGLLRGSSATLAILDSYREGGMMIDTPPPRDRNIHSHDSGVRLPRRAGPSVAAPVVRQRQPLFPRLRGGR